MSGTAPPLTDVDDLAAPANATVDVVGWRDVNGNDFEIDADGNLTSRPLDLRRRLADRIGR